MLSIITVTHNGAALARQCMAAIARAKFAVEYEFLLVDNASSDDTVGLPEEFRSRIPNIHCIRNQSNLSFAAANNKAADSARGDRLLFLNNDVFVDPESIAHLMGFMTGEKSVGAVGAKLLYPDSNSIQHAGLMQMLWGYTSNYGVGACSDDIRFNLAGEVFAVTGAMLCVDRALFNKLGGFDPGYFYGYEDVDLCLKIRSSGFKVCYVPEAVGYHRESATLKNSRNPEMSDGNYDLFRSRWDPVLIPAERRYLAELRKKNICRTVIFGTGRAAAGLFRALNREGIEVVGFTSTNVEAAGSSLFGLPVITLEGLKQLHFDRILVGSQYYFQVENLLADYDPLGNAIFPAVSQSVH